MSDMRDLISKLDRLDERQNHRELNGVVDQYARQGMTLQDLAAMEQAASEMQTSGQGFLGGLGAALRSVGQTEDFKVNYVLYHAGEKLGLNGMFGTDGKLRTLNGATYNSEEVRPTNAGARNIAVAQARLGVLPTNVQTKFSIQAGGQGETMRPTREFFFDPTARSLQGHSISNFRGTEPYIDVTLQRELTRVYTRERNAEALRNAYPDATVMKADGSGPYFEQPESGRASPAASDSAAVQNAEPASAAATAATNATLEPTGNEYKDTLDDFVAPTSNQGGLRNNPEAAGAIKELNTRLSALGFTNIQAGSEEYSRATDQAIRDFQRAYNRMYVGTTNAANTTVPERIRVDGDLGPNTYRALQEVENTFSTIERLLAAASPVTDSIIFKSSISKMIEGLVKEELTQTQMGELTGKLIAIDKFIGAAGENYNIDSRKQMLINARTAVSDHVAGISTEPTPNIVRLSNGGITPVGTAATANAVTRNDVEAEVGAAQPGRTVTSANREAVTYTGNFAEDRITFYKTPMARSDAEAFIAAISLEGKDIRELLEIDNNLRRVMSVLNGNRRVPDEVGEPNGGTIVQKRDAVEIIRTYRQGPLMDAQRNPVAAANNSDTVEPQTFDWGQRTGNTVSGESTQANGNTIRWEITVENDQVTMRVGQNLVLSNVNIRQPRDGVTPFEAISNGTSNIYQMANPGYQNLNNALEYIRDNMLEAA
jgi:hypothetical protein